MRGPAAVHGLVTGFPHRLEQRSCTAAIVRDVPTKPNAGTSRGMDAWLDRSELYSDEGTLFGHQGIGAWEDAADEFKAWILRPN